MINAVWIDNVSNFFEENTTFRVIVDAYFILFIISFVIYLMFRFKKALLLWIIGVVIGIITWFSSVAGLVVSQVIYPAVLGSYIVISFIILAPEVRKHMEFNSDNSIKTNKKSYTTKSTIEAIVDAAFDLSANKVGALITVELGISLDQYASRAISLNSDVSKELLEQIFIKDSPLHDGGVIIRGNKIICAAAYYNLTQDISLDKTVGSRHRAGVGISEVTDSLTVIVSEETGSVHFANQGIMQEVYTKNELIEWLSTYLGEGENTLWKNSKIISLLYCLQ